MNEIIKDMVDVLKEFDADYVDVELGEYTIFITTKETADFMRKAFEESEVQE